MKKSKVLSLIAVLCVMAMSFTAFMGLFASAATLKGDVNQDGKVNSSDARIILRVAAKLETIDDAKKAIADMNDDTKVNSSDARQVLRIAAKLEPTQTMKDEQEPTEPSVAPTQPSVVPTQPSTAPSTAPVPTTSPVTPPTTKPVVTEPSVEFVPDDSNPPSVDIGGLN